jgi:flagellar biosynthesis/type III secretory pathway M-ring protein FliF/YscJ
MELSRTIASVAVVLAVILAAGHAYSEAMVPATAQPTAQQKLDEREAQRRVAVEEQQKRKDAFERACTKPMKSDTDYELCRAAYKRLDLAR